MKYQILENICQKVSSNIKQSDLVNNNGDYPIYGASGFIKNVDFYTQDKPYIGIVKDGAGVGRVMKLPAFSSVIGTMQYIIPNDDIDVSYLAYAMEHMNLSKYYMGAAIPHIYFKDYKNEKLPNHTKDEQAQIVHKLDLICDLITKRNNQLSKLDELIKSRFVEMFGDFKTNPYNFEKKKLKDTCDVITGNTPSRAIAEYYGDYIEWIKTDNIVTGQIYPTQANEYLSFDGMNVGRFVDKDSILMSCIAGSLSSIGRVCITDRKVAFNQQINALSPKEYNVYFLYILLLLSKDYLVEEINMALKGILSKSGLGNKEYILPPIELQNQFADFVTQVEKQKATVQQSIDKLETLKKSLMQECFG